MLESEKAEGRAAVPGILSEEETDAIHDGALRVLSSTGVRIHDGEVVELLADAGGQLHLEAEGLRVTLPRNLISEALSKAPSVVTLYNQAGDEAMALGKGRFHTRTSSGATGMLDLESGARRPATSQDAADVARLADALPNIVGVSTMAVQPADVPASSVDVHAVRLALENTSKPLGYVCLNERLIEPVLEMVAAAVGGEEELRRRPIVTGLAESTSPLQLVSSQMAVLKAFAGRRLPLTLHAHPMAGLTAPVTLAGELTVTHAEILALITVAQLYEPGTPVVYGLSSSVPDMRNASNLAGAVEIGLLGSAVAQLARRCGVPAVMSSGSDAHAPGAQSVFERLMTLLPPALAGVDLINLSTLETKMSFSLEQLVIDDAIVGAVQRLLRGVGVEEETLALDLILEMGPGGAFISADHTLEHYQDELHISALIDHQSRDAWRASGAPNMVQRARAHARGLLANHQPHALAPQVVAEFDRIVDAVDCEDGVV